MIVYVAAPECKVSLIATVVSGLRHRAKRWAPRGKESKRNVMLGYVPERPMGRALAGALAISGGRFRGNYLRSAIYQADLCIDFLARR
jgi:hypothetical protein